VKDGRKSGEVRARKPLSLARQIKKILLLKMLAHLRCARA
jgi:hypothetical protein